MPKRQSASRSLFAALPQQLRQSIRSKATSTISSNRDETFSPVRSLHDNSDKDVTPNPADLLPTQPQSPLSSPEPDVSPNISLAPAGDSAVDEPVAGPSRIPIAFATPTTSSALKRKLDHVTSIQTPQTPTCPPLTGSLHPAPSTKKNKKRKTLENKYQNHPWDCSNLVQRYTNPSQVPPDLVKYWYQRLSLFPLYDQLPLLLDTTGWFSVTPHAIAAQIADRCTCDVILDAFCGVGGNAIEFARTCERVIAMDNDPVRLRLARHNALHHGVADRIEFVLGDCVEFARSQAELSSRHPAKKEEIDVVFLSPPWGGPDYLSFTASPSKHSETPVAESYPLSSILPINGQDLFNLSSSLTPNIAYFLPRNVNIQEVADLAPILTLPDGTRKREWVEVEEEWVGDKLKAVTAYFGGLANLG